MGDFEPFCLRPKKHESPANAGLSSYSGGRIRTCDLRVMSPTSYLAAPPRGGLPMVAIPRLWGLGKGVSAGGGPSSSGWPFRARPARWGARLPGPCSGGRLDRADADRLAGVVAVGDGVELDVGRVGGDSGAADVGTSPPAIGLLSKQPPLAGMIQG